jgi:hypothetical protein
MVAASPRDSAAVLTRERAFAPGRLVRMRVRGQFASLAVVIMVLVAAPAARAAGRSVPAGFVGMNADGPSFSAAGTTGHQFKAMVASGVESVRVVFDWSAAQPYPDWNQVPLSQVGNFAPDLVPTSFAATDQIVGLAARRQLTVLPVVLYAPWWDQAPHPAVTLAAPRSPVAYANYLGLLVNRYGPSGSFWRTHPWLPKMPIRMWQIWNEPNLLNFWPAPLVPDYVNLLRAVHTVIKHADPGAKVVLAGMPDYVWTDLARLYQGGARDLFDVVAVHPYTKTVQGVITILSLVRRVMDEAGDRHKPIILTELNWPAALHRTPFYDGFETTDAGQARKLAAVLPLLARNRQRLGLMGFYYYTWMTDDVPGGDPFQFAGLLGLDHGRFVRKPAFTAFRRAALALEGCVRKGPVATRCAQPG